MHTHTHTHTHTHMCTHMLFIEKKAFDSMSCKLAYRSLRDMWNTFYDYRFLYWYIKGFFAVTWVRYGFSCSEPNFQNTEWNCIQIIISIQPWRPGLAGTRAQSCDRYGSGTLPPGQVLGGSLPLLSPAFRCSHFSRQVPPSATTREILAAKGGTVGEKNVR